MTDPYRHQSIFSSSCFIYVGYNNCVVSFVLWTAPRSELERDHACERHANCCSKYILQIAPRRGRPSLEALACVGNIAKAMGPAMEHDVRGLLDVMFAAGLSSTLVEALEKITTRYTGFVHEPFLEHFL